MQPLKTVLPPIFPSSNPIPNWFSARRGGPLWPPVSSGRWAGTGACPYKINRNPFWIETTRRGTSAEFLRGEGSSSRSVTFEGLNTTSIASAIDPYFQFIGKTRTREMLFEDVMGFGILRTTMDLFRERFFEKRDTNHRELNIPAARERTIRELGSIFTDNFLGGIIASAIAWGANRLPGRTPNFSNQFASNETLELFNKLSNISNSKAEFVKRLSNKIAPGNNRVYQLLIEGIRSKKQEGFENSALSIAKIINSNKPLLDRSLDVSIGKTFKLDSLIEDSSKFLKLVRKNVLKNKIPRPKGRDILSRFMRMIEFIPVGFRRKWRGIEPNGNNIGWQSSATKILQETSTINRWRLPLGIGIAMASTMAVPYINKYITRKLDGTISYPGEKGLRELTKADQDKDQPWYDRWFPYISKSLKENNLLPLLISLIPIPFAIGVFDVEKLSTEPLKSLGSAINNPFKLGARGFLKKLVSMMQFGKGFPFTTQQQMASCFAFLIFSRLTTTRSDIEFRERLVDSFLGWTIWILATPRIKKVIAQWWDKSLLKRTGLRSRTEMQLLPKWIRNSALPRFTIMGASSLIITLLLLGIIEPYLAIKWTEWQAKRSKANI